MRFTIRHPQGLAAVAVLLLLCSSLCHAIETQAISVPFGPDFLGYDGLWSPVQIRVGTPEQWLLVFPSTTSSETWVAGPALCTSPTCSSLRGGIFDSGNSTSWRSLGDYELGFSALTETTQQGVYGFDSIALDDTFSAANQIIAVTDSVQEWNGHLGLGVTETRFTNNTDYLPLISTLVQNNSVIPSHSYGYTAGASYKGSGVSGSLTLGGADIARYVPNSVWFTLTNGNIPSLALMSMQVSSSSPSTNWSSNPLQLFSNDQAATFTIDSSTPFLWLPEPVCENIAKALSLTWDPDLELYLPVSGSPQDLINMGLNFTFNFAKSVSSSETLSLHVSYDAFNLQLSYPYPGLSSNYSTEKLSYFPLRRANNTLQYTIGRAFLQETYLIVEYESNSFALAQALFPDDGQTEIAKIPRPAGSLWPGPGGSDASSMSTAAKIGIVVAVIVVLCVTGVLGWFCFMRNRQRGRHNLPGASHKSSIFSMFSRRSTRRPSLSLSAVELVADKVHPTEMNTDASASRYELPTSAPVEMAAADVAPSFFQERSRFAVIPQRNDPRTPVELTQPSSRNSVAKRGARVIVTEEDPRVAVPAYSTADGDQTHSNSHSSSGHGISPNSARRSGELFRGGSDHPISPITGNESDHGRQSRPDLSHSESDSSRFLSPMSPVPARADGRISSQIPNRNESPVSIQDGSDCGTISPVPNAASQPRRSTSRDSRFIQELVRDPQAQTMPAQSRKTSRFSWEM